VSELHFYYDVVCPYAYMAATRVEDFAAAHGVSLIWKPVLLGGFFRKLDMPDVPASTYAPAKARLNLLDVYRSAERLGLDRVRFPQWHPRRSVDAMRLLIAAPADLRPQLSLELYRAYWERHEDIADHTVLARYAQAAGLAPDLYRSDDVKQDLIDATSAAHEAGVFGVPTYQVVHGDEHHEVWWGQDRLHFVSRQLGRGRDHALPWTRGTVGGEGPRPERVAFFHDFASPFSYLASTQIDSVAAACTADVERVPILLGALFQAIGTANVPLYTFHERKRDHYGRDMGAWARWWGVDLLWPDTFPLRTVLPLRVAIVEPQSEAAMYRAAWVDDLDIGTSEVLESVLDAAGFPGRELIAATRDPAVKRTLRDNTDRAIEAGVCGVPTFEVDGRLYWGQDRIPMLQDVLGGWQPSC